MKSRSFCLHRKVALPPRTLSADEGLALATESPAHPKTTRGARGAMGTAWGARGAARGARGAARGCARRTRIHRGYCCGAGLGLVLLLAACEQTATPSSVQTRTTDEAVAPSAQEPSPIAPSEKLRQAAEALAREDWYAAQDLARSTLQEAHALLVKATRHGIDPANHEDREQAQLFLLYALILLGEVWHAREDCARATVPLTRAVLLWRAGKHSEQTLVYADLLSRRASCAARLDNPETRQGTGQDLAYALSLVQAAEEQGGDQAHLAQTITTRIAQATLWLYAYGGAVETVEQGLNALLSASRQSGDGARLFADLVFAAEVRLLIARSARQAEDMSLAAHNYQHAAAHIREGVEYAKTGVVQSWFVLVRLHRAGLEVRRAEQGAMRQVANHALALAEIWQAYSEQENLSEKSRFYALRQRGSALQQAAVALAAVDEGEAVRALLQEAVATLSKAQHTEHQTNITVQGLRELLQRTKGDDAALLQALAG